MTPAHTKPPPGYVTVPMLRERGWSISMISMMLAEKSRPAPTKLHDVDASPITAGSRRLAAMS